MLWDEWKMTKFAVARPTVAHHTLRPFHQVFRAFNGADSTSGRTQWRCCGCHLDDQPGFNSHCLLKYCQIQQFGWTGHHYIDYRGSILGHCHYHRNNDHFLHHHHHHNHHNSSELRMWFDVYINWNNLQ